MQANFHFVSTVAVAAAAAAAILGNDHSILCFELLQQVMASIKVLAGMHRNTVISNPAHIHDICITHAMRLDPWPIHCLIHSMSGLLVPF